MSSLSHLRRAVKSDFRSEIVELHREIFDENQRRISEAVAGYTPAFRRYEREYGRRVTQYQRRASFDELERRIADADVVYVGDYHTLTHSQRGFMRLLRRAPAERPVVIALEFLRIRHQRAVDTYLAGELSEARFLEAIDYHGDHGTGDWASFKQIFDYARYHGMRVVGLDTVGRGPSSPLVNRDRAAGRVIAKELCREPAPLVFALVGELHVAPEHLPQRVHEALRRRGLVHEPLIVYQNCHEIYWQLASRGHEHDVEVVRLARGEYYVLNTLPIVAQQSFLNWITRDEDHQVEAPEATFLEYAEVIAEFFDLELGDALDEVDVTTIVDLSFLSRLQRRGDFSAADMRHIHRQIRNSESYFIPRANMVYLGNLSVNHTAEEASHFVRAVCSDAQEPRLLVDAFYARALEEAVGFLGSKLLNHKRRAPTVRTLERQAKSRRASEQERHVARLALKHLRMEAGLRIRGGSSLYECDADTFNQVTHLLGYILGEKIYYALVAGDLAKSDVRDLFLDDFEEEGVALTTYLYFVSRCRKIRRPE